MRKYNPLTWRGARVVNDVVHSSFGHCAQLPWPTSSPQDSNPRLTGLGRLIRKKILLLYIWNQQFKRETLKASIPDFLRNMLWLDPFFFFFNSVNLRCQIFLQESQGLIYGKSFHPSCMWDSWTVMSVLIYLLWSGLFFLPVPLIPMKPIQAHSSIWSDFLLWKKFPKVTCQDQKIK